MKQYLDKIESSLLQVSIMFERAVLSFVPLYVNRTLTGA